MKKRILSISLAIIMVVSLLPTMALADTVSPENDFEFNNGIITKYKGSGGDVVIPATIGGVEVTAIGERAFDGCNSLLQISLPASIKRIDKYAFCNSGLVGIKLPEGLISVGEAAFIYCTDLRVVEIPSSLTTIGDFAFESCGNLEYIDVEAENRFFCSVDGVLFNKSMNTLITYPNGNFDVAYSIPESVTSIGNGAFFTCTNLQELSIPSSVNSIGKYVFNNYGRTKPLSIYYEGTRAQWNHVNIGTGNDEINSFLIYFDDEKPDIISYKVSNGNIYFDKATGTIVSADKTITDAVIPERISGITVKKIAGTAFSDCKSLKYMTLPDCITEIGEYAFNRCSSLISLNIPDCTTRIGSSAFFGCSLLKKVSFPESLQSVGDCAFEKCSSLKYIKIPASLKALGNQVFMDCNGLEYVEICNGLGSIPKRTFSDCTSLKTIYIPSSVAWIGCYAFSCCSNLQNVCFEGSFSRWKTIAFLDESDRIILEKASIYYDSSISWFNDLAPESEENDDQTSLPDSSAIEFQIQGTADYKEAFAVLDRLNSLRKSNGLSPLTMDETLLEAAMQRAAELLIYYGHERPNGRDCFSVISTNCLAAGENIAAGYTSAKDVMEGWTNSPGHYSNMVNDNFNAVGIGCFYQENGAKCWAQVFTGGVSAAPAHAKEARNNKFSITARDDRLHLCIYPDEAVIHYGETIDCKLMSAVNLGCDFLSAEIIPSYCVADDPSIVEIRNNSTIRGMATGTTTVRIGIDQNYCAETTITVDYTQGMTPSGWAEKEVFSAIAANLVPEKLQRHYTLPVSRGDVAQMFINLIEQSGGKTIDQVLTEKGLVLNKSAFTDTSDKAVLAANALGIIYGTGNDKFSPDTTLTRSQIAAIINRTAKALGVNTDGYSHNFKDVSGHWVDSELGWPYSVGIINGVGDNMFSPDTKLTTEQAIAITYRALQVLRK